MTSSCWILSAHPEFNFTIGQGHPKKTHILLNRCSLTSITPQFLSYDGWFHENHVSQEVLDDLVNRNPRGVRYELVDYQPGSQDISLTFLNKDELGGDYGLRFPGACGFVVPHLPGYSKDGKTALFHFSIPPLGYHPGWGCYLLEKLEWALEDRSQAYLPFVVVSPLLDDSGGGIGDLQERAMRIARVQFSLSRLMIVVMAQGVNFGVFPWPACAVLGVALTLPLFLSPATLIEWLVISSIAGVLAGLSLPVCTTHCHRGGITVVPASPPVVPVAVSPCEASVDIEKPE